MQFTRIDDYLAASRITGPHHNLLQLRISTDSQAEPVCECLPPIGECIHEPLNKQELVAMVVEGVKEANQQLGSSYSVTHIRYVANDTKPETVYGLLALKIIKHLEVGGEFIEAKTFMGNQ
jgi:hypothetical protein